MRAIASAFTFLLLSSTLFSQINTAPKPGKDHGASDSLTCPRTHVLQGKPEKQYWFEGTIEQRKVRMYLHRAGADVVGLFYPTEGDWVPTLLGGEWNSSGITISGESADEVPKGSLQGKLVGDTFIGSWTTHSSNQAEPVRVAATPRPACDAGGVWKRFDDPKWPVSFLYPASWQVQQVPKSFSPGNVDSELQLVCPDPEVMTYDTAIRIYEGKRMKDQPIGPWSVLHCSKGWMQDVDDCDDSDQQSSLYRVTEVSRQPDKTVLDVDHEWRVSCADGGYRGQGEGDSKVVLLSDFWVQFDGEGQSQAMVDRLVKSAVIRVAPESK